MHLACCTIRIYYDSRIYERHITMRNKIEINGFTWKPNLSMTTVQQPSNIRYLMHVDRAQSCPLHGNPKILPTSRRRNVPVRTVCRISAGQTHTLTDTHTQCATLSPVPSYSPLNLICLNKFFTKTAVNAILGTWTCQLIVCQHVTMTDFDQISNSEFTPNFGRPFWFRCTLSHCNGSLCCAGL